MTALARLLIRLAARTLGGRVIVTRETEPTRLTREQLRMHDEHPALRRYCPRHEAWADWCDCYAKALSAAGMTTEQKLATYGDPLRDLYGFGKWLSERKAKP